MIGTIVQIAALRLWNNKQELVLTFVVPVLFFSIFAYIFVHGIAMGTSAISLAIVDDDGSSLSRRVIQAMGEQETIELVNPIYRTNAKWPVERLTQSLLIQQRADVVVYFPAELSEAMTSSRELSIPMFLEGSHPIARQLVEGVLLQTLSMATSETSQVSAQDRGAQQDDDSAVRLLPSAIPTEPNANGQGTGEILKRQAQLVKLDVQDVFADQKYQPRIAMYAAGIAVMFLLFSATGAGGSLLEDEEAGTLDRLLSSRLNVSQLMAGKWVFITGLGCLQITVMFLWAQLVFGVELWGHLGGFALMTFATSAATASFALLLASVCRSRAQLNAVSIIVVLSMSALGGSMVPRFVMSDKLKQWGRITFNAWALDGYQKVFWYELPLRDLSAEVNILLAMTVALACMARYFGERWEPS